MPYCRLSVSHPEDEKSCYWAHLHPLFLQGIPSASDITRARKVVLEWLRLGLLGPRTSLLELSEKVRSHEVFSSPPPIPKDIREAMDAFCLEVGEELSRIAVLGGDKYKETC